jgi:predicted MPP superfamily phosphohydrolase
VNPLLFTAALLGVFALLNMYISKRLITHLDITQKHKRNFRLFLYLNLVGILFYALGRYYIDIPGWLYFLFSLPIGIIFLLFCTTLVYDISRVMLNYLPLSDTRRKFFKRSLDASSFAVATTLSLSAVYEARHVELEEVEIKIDKLKKPYKIAQISDIHIGGLINKGFLKDIVTRINSCKPDLVVITGDLIDIDIKKAQPALEELKKLQSTYGTYYIVGNHEYFHGIEDILNAVKSLGIRALENENVYIGEQNQGFNLAGVDDLFGYRMQKFMPDITKALQDLQDAPTVLLAHQPKFLEEVKNGVDLVLSGHTHGGQLYPFRFLVGLQQPYISGLHQHTKELQIYVNKGTGFWGPPMRLGASAEITDITLLPA